MRKLKLFAIMLLALALSCSVFAVAYADTTDTAKGVIVKEVTYVNIADATTATWYAHGSVVTDNAPAQGKGASEKPTAGAAALAYWTPGALASPVHDVVTSLGVTYSDTTTDLGTAIWLYIGNKQTLSDVSKGTVRMQIGNSSTSHWKNSTISLADFDLVVGWNELVLKPDITWKSGTPDMTSGIGYVQFFFESMGTTVTHDILLNDFRLVKTTQTAAVVLNRTEELDGYIVNEVSYAELGATGVTNGAGGSVTSDLHPVANTEKSIKYTIGANGNAYWAPYVNLTTAFTAYDTLGVTYTSSTSNLGVALWLYIADEASLNSLSTAVFDFYLGQNSSNRWVTLSGKAVANYNLVVGWNELVFKQNITWKNGSPDMTQGISYVSLGIRSMTNTASRTFAINGIRLVKTSQTTELVINHNEVTVKGYEATCTENGKTDGVKCTVCNEFVVAQTEIITEGHDYDGAVTEPTCTDAGYTTYTCGNCGDTYVDDEVEAKGHDYNGTVTEPTCTDAGYTTYTCGNCGDTYVGDEVEANGHDYNGTVTEPTCTDAGYTTYTCGNCGDTYVGDEVEANGHDVVKTEAVEATETEDGNTEYYTCSDCGKFFSDAEGENEIDEGSWVIPALGTDSGSGDSGSNTDSNINTGSTTEGCIAGVGTASFAFSGICLAVYTFLKKKRS